MKINTKHFGEVEINQEKIIKFENGVPGFPESKNYILLGDMQANQPFCWLQSTDNSETAFTVTSPYVFYNEYKPDVPDEEMANIMGANDTVSDISVFSIMVVPNDVKETTLNLKAPVIINSKTNKGAQIIVNNEEYGVRHRITDLVEASAM